MVTGGPGKIVQQRAGRTLQKREKTGNVVQTNPGGSLQERAKTGGKVQNNFAGSGVLKNVFLVSPHDLLQNAMNIVSNGRDLSHLVSRSVFQFQ